MNDDSQKLIEGEDYYLNEEGLFVFTEKYLLKRGYCCNNGCRHCPYGYSPFKERIIRNSDATSDPAKWKDC